MSEFDIGYFKKRGKLKQKISRDLKTKFLAWKLGKDYYDGDRNNGYGGFKYDGRWLKILPKIIKKYNLKNNSKILDLGCKKGFIMKDLKILLPGSEVWGIEDHKYPIIKAEKEIKKKITREAKVEIDEDIQDEDNPDDLGFLSDDDEVEIESVVEVEEADLLQPDRGDLLETCLLFL